MSGGSWRSCQVGAGDGVRWHLEELELVSGGSWRRCQVGAGDGVRWQLEELELV